MNRNGWMARSALVGLMAFVCSSHVVGQAPIGDWTFVPDYRLGGKAANYPGPRVEIPRGEKPLVEMETTPFRFKGDLPTERLTHLLSSESLPREQFTVEMWMLHHVNQPVGIAVAAKGIAPGDPVPWCLGFHNWSCSLTMQGHEGAMVQFQNRMKKWSGFLERWVHLVATYNGDEVIMYVNGDEVARGHIHHDQIAWPEQTEFEMAAFMKNEPFMQFADLAQQVRIYDYPLEAEQIIDRFKDLQKDVSEARLYADLFHFTAGPYLNFATQNSVRLVWETDRKSEATVEWGKTAQLGEKVVLGKLQRLHEFDLPDLKPNTPYFYQITCSTEDEKIYSGLLTFKTAVEPDQPFKFAVIGDTESRPHVNDRLCKLIWAERPNFMINVGDLTDGGKGLHRYEWTHEYFVGMTQLTSRVPMFAVPGNGEGDLVWYNRYHSYPEPENFYEFRFGDSAFFMLDSNQRKDEFAPGGKQYEWLKPRLAKCDARWKFVCHHHATYTGEEDDYGNTWKEGTTFGDPAVQKILPLYEEMGVDMVLFGHLHLYERSHPIRKGKVDFKAGTIHLLAGGGGGNLEDFAPTPAFFSAKTHRGHHYVMIESANGALEVRMHDTNGAIRDHLRLTKTSPGKIATKRILGAESVERD